MYNTRLYNDIIDHVKNIQIDFLLVIDLNIWQFLTNIDWVLQPSSIETFILILLIYEKIDLSVRLFIVMVFSLKS